MSSPSKINLATMYGVGLVKRAPGTAGSLVAALMAYGVLLLPHGWTWLLVGTALFSLLGTWAAERYMQQHETAHDPSEIVVDELAGQWLTYLVWYLMIGGAAASRGVALTQVDIDTAPQFLALGFVAFRIFDIFKPWPISWCDRHLTGGFGVMMDDLLAAIPAGALLYGVYVYWPLVFGTMESIP